LADGSPTLWQAQFGEGALDRDDLGAEVLEGNVGPVRAN
jgi:hypothetical protein